MSVLRSGVWTMILAAWAAPAVTAGDDFFLIDNSNNGFFRSDTSHVPGDVLVQTQGDFFWGDLCPSNQLFHLYATRVTSAQIATIRESDGAVVAVLNLDRQIRSHAYDVAGGVLYGLPQSGAVDLYTIDTTTGATQSVGDTGIPESAIALVSMAYDPVTGLLYAGTLAGNLYSIDPATAAGTLVGNFGLTNPFGLAQNPKDGLLYLTDAQTDTLYEISKVDASLDVIGGPLSLATFATGTSFSNQVCQEDIGFQGPGIVDLSICGGDLTIPGSTARLEIEHAEANAAVVLFVGFSSNPTPFAGGLLVPIPPALIASGLVTDGNGELNLPVTAAGFGVTLYTQAVVVGSSLELSNALRVEL